MSGGFAGWAIEALIASTLLLVFVLAVRKLAQRGLGAQLAYWLWALPALRMALPPLPASWHAAASAPISGAGGTVLVYFDPGTASAGADAGTAVAAAAPSGPSLLVVIAALWVLGGIGFFVWHALSHLAYVRRILRPPARREALADGTTLVESDAATGPVAFGVLKRFVAVPSDFAERYEAEERKLALAHELGHHARGDLIANWIALAMLALHWFNPIAWIAYRRFRADQEAANDARVLASLKPIERHAYACAIVKAAHGRAVAAACHLHTIEDLKGRLRMLKANRKSRRVLMAGAMGIAGLTVGGLGLTASGAAAEKLRSVATTSRATTVDTSLPGAAFVQADDAPPAAANRQRRVVIVKDGKRTEYVGADADAYIAAHPEMAPPAPPAPPVMGADAMPPAPPAPPAAGTRAMRVIVRDKVGDIRTEDFGAMPPPRDIPEVASMNCPGSARNKQVVINSREGSKQKIVICTNRIEQMSADAMAQAGNTKDIERNAYRSALQGLRLTRERMLHKGDMSDDEREEAVSAIDESIAEIEADLARVD